MSSALSNLAATFSVSPLSSSSHSRRRPTNNGMMLCVKAMGNQQHEVRENLDHLQRANKQQQLNQSQPQAPKKRIAAAQSPPLGLWDRFPTARTIQQMMDTMDRIIEDPFAYSSQRSSLPSQSNEEQGSYRRGRTPWEIREKENEYKLRFDMPGMTKSDVKVWVEEKMMVIKAEKPAKKQGEGEGEEEEEEWSFGKYKTRIALPENAEVEKIKAEVKDGVLYISIPKAQAFTKVLDIDVQ